MSLDKFLAPMLTFGGNLLNNFFAGERQEDAQQFSAQQFATRYQTTVKDMQSAGLNPALAYQQGGGTAPTSSAAGAAGGGDIGAAYLQQKMNTAQIANVNADTRNKESQTDNIEADTALKRAQMFLTTAQEGLAGASADQARQNIALMETQAKKIIEEIKNIPKEGNRLDALVKNLAEEYHQIKAKTGNLEMATNQLRWLATKTMIESDLLSFDLKAAQDLGNLGRYSKEGKVVLDVIREIRRK